MSTDFFYDVRWRHHTPVYQQGNIPVCWAAVTADAVASLAVVEGLVMKYHPVVPPLASQELVDWVPFLINGYEAEQIKDGRYLGNVGHGFEYIKRHGVHVESAYPYRMNSGLQMQLDNESIIKEYQDMVSNGRYPTYKRPEMERITIDSYVTLESRHFRDPTEYAAVLLNQLRYQPIAGGMRVNINHFANFQGKEMYVHPPGLEMDENHAIMITGFGHECGGRGRAFIEIKNSHGPQWGDGYGYGKVLPSEIFIAWYPVGVSIYDESAPPTHEANDPDDFPDMEEY